MATYRVFPDFEKPPVTEVVCGIQFKELSLLFAPHLGLLWEKFKTEYPGCQEIPPLVPTIERFDKGPSTQLDFTDKPPLPRIWFTHTEGNRIVQVQRDRLLHNWKKIRAEDEYPRYGTVIGLFRKHLSSFEAFVKEAALGSIEPVQYEMTYVNFIPQGEGWNSLGELGKVFPDFAWQNEVERFLPQAEAVNWHTSFVLPERVGRLHATVRNAARVEDNVPVIRFELTARGMPPEPSKDAMWRWFDLAHEWIVRGFADLTGDAMHTNVWRKKQ